MFTRLITLLPIVVRLAAVTAAMPNGLKARDGVCSTFDSREYCCTPALYGPTVFTGELGSDIHNGDITCRPVLQVIDNVVLLCAIPSGLACCVSSTAVSTVSFYHAFVHRRLAIRTDSILIYSLLLSTDWHSNYLHSRYQPASGRLIYISSCSCALFTKHCSIWLSSQVV
ncbi:hypothetical protein V8E55_009296 [Tylopilus felleus]